MTTIRDLLAHRPPYSEEQKAYIGAKYMYEQSLHNVNLAIQLKGPFSEQVSPNELFRAYYEAMCIFDDEFHRIALRDALDTAECAVLAWGYTRLQQERDYPEHAQVIDTIFLRVQDRDYPEIRKHIIELVMQLRPLPLQASPFAEERNHHHLAEHHHSPPIEGGDEKLQKLHPLFPIE